MGGSGDKKTPIVIVGGGGHGKVVASILDKLNYNIVGFVDVKEKIGTYVYKNYKVVATDEQLEELFRSGITNAVIGIGSVGNSNLRIKMYKLLKHIGFKLPVVISPEAIVDETVLLDEGTVIMAGAVIQPSTTVGKMVIVNTKASIDHDCFIGDFVHIAPGVTLSGGVRVGNYSHIGTGASIIQGVSIGSHTIVGAGAVVVKDVPDGKVAKGVPAKW